MSDNIYEDLMKFDGTWRSYQAAVLEKSDEYIKDGRIHVVAAPGAGKTTLGIELIRRAGNPALILSPRIVIREQWLSRIEESFLTVKPAPTGLLSNDIRKPGRITAITYQTLYSALNRKKGAAPEDLDDDVSPALRTTVGEDADYTLFDLAGTIAASGIKTLCLDECHHLRHEWWLALGRLIELLGGQENITIIALTATPPYDSDSAEWKRYTEVCGPIDCEITIPELVKEKSLCPHQDYIYFNRLTPEEQQKVEQFASQSEAMLKELKSSTLLKNAIAKHPALRNSEKYADKLLADSDYALALLSFANETGVAVDRGWFEMADLKKLPEVNGKMMADLLQGFLISDTENFPGPACDDLRKIISGKLRARGMLVKSKVIFDSGEAASAIMSKSLGKLRSIVEIASYEYESMGSSLRLLVLTDFIRKEYLGSSEEPASIGVIPIFEKLREKDLPWRLCVLCGSCVIVPEGAVEDIGKRVEQLAPGTTFRAAETVPGYRELSVTGDMHVLTSAITAAYGDGAFEVMIGTKSLLGEGWDAPCVNSLIFASFVGSYILGNQMRGRAIRTDRNNPSKVSNIWHLVSVPVSLKSSSDSAPLLIKNLEKDIPDYAILTRRMRGVMGISYDSPEVTDSMARFSSVIRGPYIGDRFEKINGSILELSRDREKVSEYWSKATQAQRAVGTSLQIPDAGKNIPTFKVSLFKDFLGELICTIIVLVGLATTKASTPLTILAGIAIALLGTRIASRLILKFSPLKNVKHFAKAVLKCLKNEGVIANGAKLSVSQEDTSCFAVLSGCTGREQEIFNEALNEALSPIKDNRYILKAGRKGNSWNYIAVPELLGTTREKADAFAKAMSSGTGEKYTAHYTRSAAGRKILLDARSRAWANRNEKRGNLIKRYM